MTQAKPVLLGIEPSKAAEIVLALDSVLNELEVVDAGTDLDDYAARRFWHAHAGLTDVRNTLAEWLGPLQDDGSLPNVESAAGQG